MAEAERWAKWQLLLKDKRRAYEKAQRRTNTELKAALDTGGSVWVFGTGPFGEFTAPPPKTLKQGGHEFAHYDVVKVRVGATFEGPLYIFDCTREDRCIFCPDAHRLVGMFLL